MTRRTTKLHWWVIVFGLVGSCAPRGLLSAQTSDHTRVISYDGGDEPLHRWQVGDTSLRVGGLDAVGAAVFHRVVGAAILGGGHLVVGDGGTSELRYFEASTGEHTATAGGEGRGPGEIYRLWGLQTIGLQVLAISANGTVSQFSEDGNYLARLPQHISDLGLRLAHLGMLRSGEVLAYARPQTTDVAPGSSTLAEMTIHVVRGDEPRFLMSYPWSIMTRPAGASRPFYLGFGPATTWAVFSDRFCIGFSARYEIDCFSPSGAHLLEIERRDWVPKRVEAEDRHKLATNRVENYNPRIQDEVRRVYRQEEAFAQFYPAYGRLLASGTGDLWVGPYAPEDEWATIMNPAPSTATVWSVYSTTDGGWLADVTLPPNFYLMWVGERSVVGTLRDEYDVESIVRLELLKTPR